MNLGTFPRRRYTNGYTALQRLDRLSRYLGGASIYIKRDDQTGLTWGGNKTRKLEFLVADALAKGADTLITVGAVQSNHCRLTLAAAAQEGLKCRLVIEERVAGSYDTHASGNHFLFRLLGAESITVVPDGTDLQAAMEQIATELKAQNRVGYVIPGGGSNALGALGYVMCARELAIQALTEDLRIDQILCTSGSAGTHAGLAVGLSAFPAETSLLGISVRRKRAEQEALVLRLANDTAGLLGSPLVNAERIAVRDEWVGPGYSLPTDEMVEAVQIVARQEAILLDPVYTGKAMAGLIAMVRSGEIAKDQNVVFIHTGGAPALYQYEDVVLAE